MQIVSSLLNVLVPKVTLPFKSLYSCEFYSKFELFSVVDAKSVQASTEDIPEEKGTGGENKETEKEVMEIDEVKRKYNKRTMRDKHGNYPVWLNQREVRKRAIENKKTKRKLKRKRIQDKQKRKKN